MPVEFPQRFGERVLHDRRKSLKLFSIETLLDKTPLCAPGFPVGGQKTFAQEVAHPLHLNFGFLVILRVGLQHVLNDGGIGRNDGFLKATQIEPERVAEELRCTLSKPVRDCGPSRANPQRSEIGKQRV